MMRQYGRYRHSLCFLASGVFIMGHAAAEPVVTYTYQPDQVYAINAGLGIATQIELDAKDEIKDFGSGFSTGWEMVRRDNVIYLKPKDLQSDTNMYVRTSKRVYLFDLRIVSKSWKSLAAAKKDGVNYKIRFDYPDAPLQQETTASSHVVTDANRAEASTRISGLRNYNTHYEFSAGKSAAWMVPVKVYDDQHFTYIQMPALTEFPSVFAREQDNTTEHLINTSVQNNTIIIHGTYPYLVLRHGKDVVGLRRN
ncbi:TrbG/VirB9 family P-type conjugative transfer protein [Leeia oryzae]|uniref:TrbG/VirB9 family P-type conjugative transfer protein n=1 Tax=Leeia oryzae TaxID=356662 RepID=UPI00035D2303|nr:TrbG/VirB9 family P-type conjugative transfer protein [Leeia oryzae]